MSGGPQNGTVSLGNNMYGPQGSPYGYGSQPMFSGYRNSGAGRFTTIPSWQPNAYVPQVYRPNLFTIPNGGVRPPPGGLLGNPPAPVDPGGTGGVGGGPGSGGTSTGTGIGTPGPGGGDSGVSSTPGGTTGQAGAALGVIGTALGIPGAFALGPAVASGVAGIGNVGPGPDANTNVSSVNAVNGLDAASDAAAVGPGGSANAAPSGVSANADGSPAGTAVGGEAGDGGGGGGGK